uniref:Secreted protein n=1 Tax=Hydatigena taeniaeformis TaxID=6205 RepID=A0A0R3WRY5_HYDTA
LFASAFFFPTSEKTWSTSFISHASRLTVITSSTFASSSSSSSSPSSYAAASTSVLTYASATASAASSRCLVFYLRFTRMSSQRKLSAREHAHMASSSLLLATLLVALECGLVVPAKVVRPRSTTFLSPPTIEVDLCTDLRSVRLGGGDFTVKAVTSTLPTTSSQLHHLSLVHWYHHLLLHLSTTAHDNHATRLQL